MNGLSWVKEWLEGLGQLSLLTREVVVSLFSRRLDARQLIYQIYFIGAKSQSVVLITGAFTGMVLAAQTYFQFHKVRMDTATMAVVSVSMCSELGPVLTGLMVAGRVGAALAAELGTMRVTEQIDALRTLATHPVDYLVVPRLLATVISMPILTALSISLGIGSGYIIGRSGGGKSVLLKLIIGLMRPDSGEVLIDGQNIVPMTERQLLNVRHRFGMLFQAAALFDSMSVADNVAFALRRERKWTAQQIERKVNEALAMVDLQGTQTKKPAALSGGMRKRDELARALVYQQEFLRYEQPTT